VEATATAREMCRRRGALRRRGYQEKPRSCTGETEKGRTGRGIGCLAKEILNKCSCRTEANRMLCIGNVASLSGKYLELFLLMVNIQRWGLLMVWIQFSLFLSSSRLGALVTRLYTFEIKTLFGRVSLQKLQLWFSSFTIKQLQQIVKVSSRSVWFVYGLQLL
jgi:hypothetical protein